MTKTASKPPFAVAAKSADPIVRAQAIHKSFRMGSSEVDVLRDVSLTIRAGEFVAIEGRSGSGKSTLLHILGALEAPTAGNVSFEGLDYTRAPSDRARRGAIGVLTHRYVFWALVGIFLAYIVLFFLQLAATARMAEDAGRDVPITAPTPWLLAAGFTSLLWVAILIPWVVAWAIRSVRSHLDDRVSARIRNREFGFVFQFYHLLPELDVVENTMLGQYVRFSIFGFPGQRAALRKRAKEVLEQLGMGHRLKHRPGQLSGGERQRVAIARALMNKPRVLFADEPTGNLDYETGRQIMDLLEALHRDHGQTIVMVTHDRALAREADRVLVLTKGRLEKAAAGEA